MISKADLSLWLGAIGVLAAIHAPPTGILFFLLGALVSRAWR
jgi:hypothetical protein